MQPTKTAEFERLARDNMDAVYTKAIHLTCDTPQAEKLVQSTFSQAYYRFDSFDRRIGFREWLFQIMEMNASLVPSAL
ncbi:hypothetical protein JXA70_01845 [candidate division KSB1 bacterium]|nr:hypothetical protein [candidate division KSB1 bacterium]